MGDQPLLIVSAGDHCDRKISRHILPLLLMFGWYIFVVNATCNNQGGNKMHLEQPDFNL